MRDYNSLTLWRNIPEVLMTFIWRNCAMYHFMEQQEADPNANQRWILGDSAYPLSPFTTTPVTNATTAAELRYNKKHAQTRNTVERAFGLLKMRFRCPA